MTPQHFLNNLVFTMSFRRDDPRKKQEGNTWNTKGLEHKAHKAWPWAYDCEEETWPFVNRKTIKRHDETRPALKAVNT